MKRACSRNRLVLVLLAIGLLVRSACHPIDEHRELRAERVLEWEALFNRSSGWTGGDGTYSIPLSGDNAPADSTQARTLFVFGDTFIGGVDPNGRRLAGATLCNNTLALLLGRQPRPENLSFFWNTDGQGNPVAALVPSTPDSNPGEWYWPMGGVSMNQTVYLFVQRMKKGRGGAFDFAVDGVTLLSASADSPRPFNHYRELELPLYVELKAGEGKLVFGAAVMANTSDAGSTNPDGFLYIYGTRGSLEGKQLVVARVPPEYLEEIGAWRFWDGHGWSPAVESTAPITVDLPSEFSVNPLAGGGYVLIHQEHGLGRNVVARFSDSPTGPFSTPILLWRCPEVNEDPDIFVYNARAHPHLSKAGELLISYDVNTFDFSDHLANARIYRPRFIHIQISALREALGIAQPHDH